MSPTSKENEVLVASPDTGGTVPARPAFRPDETASRPNPVALEVPVSVNGARTVEGSDKREPFSETTKTVLVFANGAVIRLSSPVSAGQLLFLTNEKTKKEVVCQVVKSKNYRSVSGYVELEFTESVVGFWGMRFPSDRIGAPAPPATPIPSVAKGTVAAPRINEANPASNPPPAPKPLLVQAPAAMSPSEVKAIPPAAAPPHAPVFEKSPVPVVPTAKPLEGSAPPQTIASSLASSVAHLLGSPEVPTGVPSSRAPASVAPPNVPAPAKNADASTEALKQQTTRLQEQLSSLLFNPVSNVPASAAGEPPAPALDPAAAAKVLEIAKSEPTLAKFVPSPAPKAPIKTPVPPIKSSLDSEEVKIPAWLEPLARNAAAPASTQELVEREKARHAAELAAQEEAKAEPLAAAAPQAAPEVEQPAITNLPPLEDESLSVPPPSKRSHRGLWIGLAATIVLAAAAAAWWYMLRPAEAVPETSPAVTRPAPAPANSTAPAVAATQPVVHPGDAERDGIFGASKSGKAAPTMPASQNAIEPEAASRPSVKTNGSQPGTNAAVKPASNAQTISNTRDNSRGSTIPASSTERIARPASPPPAARAEPEAKKPSLGDIHLAAPKVNRSEGSQNDGVAAPAMPGNSDAAEDLGSGLVDNSKQPTAPPTPLPVGGDVITAKLISSVPPVYPPLARNQHISGDVTLDALIDANGKVTTMKVISGPTLLRQAAQDALRQWKYQPASLDGKAVPMHLTVTVQFRMQ